MYYLQSLKNPLFQFKITFLQQLKLDTINTFLNNGVVKEIAEKHNKQKRSICNQCIEEGDIAFSCHTCSSDLSAVYCADCFLHSNHENHNWYVKNTSSGQCDCGDTGVFFNQNFCSKHCDLNENLTFNLTLDELKIVIQQLYIQIKHEKMCETVETLIQNSQLLSRIASIIVLLFDEDITYDLLLTCINNDDYKVFYQMPKYQVLPESIFAKFIQQMQTSDNNAFWGYILPADQFFRVYSLRQIGCFSKFVFLTPDKAVHNQMIQCINEPLGLYYCKNWGTLIDLMEFSNIYTQLLVKTGITLENLDQNLQYLFAVQGFQYSNTAAAAHTIIYTGKNYFSSFFIKQHRFSCYYSCNINNDYSQNQNEIYNNYIILIHFLVEDCYYSYQLLNFLDLKYIDEQNMDELDMLVKQVNIKNGQCKQLQIQNKQINDYEYQIHTTNLTNLLKTYLQLPLYQQLYEKYVNNKVSEEYNYQQNVFSFMPDTIFLQYLRKIQSVFNLNKDDQIELLQKIIKTVNIELQLQLTKKTLIQILLHELIRSRKMHAQINYGFISLKQNLLDFQSAIDQIDNQGAIQFSTYEQFNLIRQFIFLIDNHSDINEFLFNIFQINLESLDCENIQLFIQFIQQLAFIPDNYSKDYIKYIISSSYENKQLSEIMYSNINLVFPMQNIIDAFNSLYYSQYQAPLVDDKLILKTTNYIEPTFTNLNFEDQQLNSNITERCINSMQAINQEVFSYITKNKQIHQILKQVLLLFDKQLINIPNTVNCIRLLKCCDSYVEDENKILHDFEFIAKHIKLSELFPQRVYENQLKIQQPQFNLKQNLKKFRNINSQSLVISNNTQEITTETTNETCHICHQELEQIFWVPVYFRCFYNYNQIIKSKEQNIIILRTCSHRFHRQCINEREDFQCPICMQMYQEAMPDVIQQDCQDLFDLQQNTTQCDILLQKQRCQKEFPGFTYINLQLKILELLISSEIDFDCKQTKDTITQYIKQIIQIIRCLIIIERISNNFIKQQKQIQFVLGRKSYQVLKQYIPQQQSVLSTDKILFELRQSLCGERQTLFSQKLLQFNSSKNLIQHLLYNDIQCFCKKRINICDNSCLIFQCLQCGNFFHSNCFEQLQGFLVCCGCESSLGVYCVQLNCVLKSVTMCYPGFYVTTTGEHPLTIYSDELRPRKADLKHLLVQQILCEFPAKINLQHFQILQKMIQVTQTQIQEVEIMVYEERVGQDFIDFIHRQNNDESE